MVLDSSPGKALRVLGMNFVGVMHKGSKPRELRRGVEVRNIPLDPNRFTLFGDGGAGKRGHRGVWRENETRNRGEKQPRGYTGKRRGG